MSQYPSPYPQPPYYQPPIDFSQFVPLNQPDLLGPARRAGALMMVVGVLMAVLGTCNGATALTTSAEEIAQQQAMLKPPGVPESPISPQAMRITTGVMAGVTLALGIGFVMTGVHVRRGSRPAVTAGMIMTGLVGAVAGLMFVMCLVATVMAPMFAVFACMFAIPFGLFIWLFFWLLGAARNSGQLTAAQQQYEAQFFQYQQQHQGYAMPAPPQMYAGSAGGGAVPWSGQWAPPQQAPAPPPPTAPSAPSDRSSESGDSNVPGAK